MSADGRTRSLAEITAAGRWDDQWAAVDTAIGALRATATVHARGVAVGTLTPDTVGVRADGSVVVAPRAIGEPDPRSRAPESDPSRPATLLDDTYALGAMLFAMLTGQAHAAGDGAPAQSLIRLRQDVDRQLAGVVGRAISPDIGTRYATADELQRDLQALRGPQPEGTELTRIDAAAADPPTPMARTAPRSPWPALALIGIAIAGTLAYFALRGDNVSVPGVAGLPAATAQQRLVDAQLKPTITQESSATVPIGQAVRTDPPAGKEVATGSSVVLFVNGSASAGTVPSVLGQTQQQAQTTLIQLGFTATFTQVPNAAPAGTVVQQSPAPGSPAAPGTAVTVSVSSGQAGGVPTQTQTQTLPGAPSGDVQVPGVIGQTVDAATTALTQAGLVVGTLTRQQSTAAPGTVLAQQPSAGAQAARGSAVALVVAEAGTVTSP